MSSVLVNEHPQTSGRVGVDTSLYYEVRTLYLTVWVYETTLNTTTFDAMTKRSKGDIQIRHTKIKIS